MTNIKSSPFRSLLTNLVEKCKSTKAQDKTQITDNEIKTTKAYPATKKEVTNIGASPNSKKHKHILYNLGVAIG